MNHALKNVYLLSFFVMEDASHLLWLVIVNVFRISYNVQAKDRVHASPQVIYVMDFTTVLIDQMSLFAIKKRTFKLKVLTIHCFFLVKQNMVGSDSNAKMNAYQVTIGA